MSTSRNLYDPDSKSLPIDDAIVTITEINGQSTCDMFHKGNGIYESNDCYPEKAHRYRLTVNSPKYGVVSGTSNVPTGGVAKIEKICDEEGEVNIRLQLQDSSQFKNHFIWDLVEVTIIEEVPTEVTGGIEGINIGGWLSGRNGNNPIKTGSTSAISSSDLLDNEGVISSNLYARSGDIKTITVIEGGQVITKKTMLRVMTVSTELFEYYKSIEDYVIYEDYQPSFEEPIKTFSNINGGTGLFAGYTVQYLDVQ